MSRRVRLPRRDHEDGPGAAPSGTLVLLPKISVLATARTLGLQPRQPVSLPKISVAATAQAPVVTNAAPTIADIIVLSAGRPVFTADNYTVDGVSGEVDAWVDHSDPTHLLAQSNSARQVAVPAGHADFGGALAADFFDNGLYISNRAASSFIYPHDGTGVSVYCTLTPLEAPWTANRFVWGTIGSGGPFALLLGGNTQSSLRMELNNGAGLIYQQQAAITANVATYVSYHYATASTPDILYQLKSATVNNSDATGAPSGSNPTNALLIGANNGFGSLGRFRWRHLMFFPLLTPSERAVVEAYILADTGLTP